MFGSVACVQYVYRHGWPSQRGGTPQWNQYLGTDLEIMQHLTQQKLEKQERSATSQS